MIQFNVVIRGFHMISADEWSLLAKALKYSVFLS